MRVGSGIGPWTMAPVCWAVSHDLVGGAVEDLVVVGFHPDADAFAGKFEPATFLPRLHAVNTRVSESIKVVAVPQSVKARPCFFAAGDVLIGRKLA